jgi:hypothetical protein
MPNAGLCEIYKWIDDKGSKNFTDDLSNIPEKYREYVVEIKSYKKFPQNNSVTSVDGYQSSVSQDMRLPKFSIPLSLTGTRITEITEKALLKGMGFIGEFYRDVRLPVNFSKVNVIFFEEFDEYKTHQKNNFDFDINIGYYQHKKREIVIFKNVKWIKTLFHEFNHYLLASYYGDAPNWIDEGLSEYFENLRVYPEAPVTVALNQNYVKRIKDRLNDDIEDDIRYVLTIPNSQWSAKNSELYTMSWAIVSFFIAQQNGDQIIKEILLKLMEGGTSKEAIDSVYPGGYRIFEVDLINFYEKI